MSMNFGLFTFGSAIARTRAVPARLDTRRHFAEPGTRDAQAAVAAVLEGRGQPLGMGNFGAAYRVETARGPVTVKLGSRRTMHTRHAGEMYATGWNQGGRRIERVREELMHEAGVSNALAGRFRVVPWAVYAEHKGKPALVREYGELGPISPGEYDQLGRELLAVVNAGWHVADELLVARRPDGSLFVADVGFWRPIEGGGEGIYEPHRVAFEDLTALLGGLAYRQPWSKGHLVPASIEVDKLRAQLDADFARGRRPDHVFVRSLVQLLERARAMRREVGLE